MKQFQLLFISPKRKQEKTGSMNLSFFVVFIVKKCIYDIFNKNRGDILWKTKK